MAMEAEPYVQNSSNGDDDESNDPLEVDMVYANLSQSNRVYARRWYVLFVYGMVGLTQGLIWNMWGPIFDSLSYVYGWGDAQLAVLPFYGTLAFSLMVIPSALFLERLGFRKLVLGMVTLVTCGSLLKVVPGPPTMVTAFVNVGAVLNGFAGSVVFFVPAYISAHWFPKNERKLSTALGAYLNGLGVALAFCIGPALVDEPSVEVTSDILKRQYFRYMYIIGGTTSFLCLVVFLYFPSKPPSPPSESALVKRLAFKQGFKALIKVKDFWYLCATSCLLLGTYSGWTPVLHLDLKRQQVDEDEAGWIGFYGSIAGILFGILISVLADKFGHLKVILIALNILAIEASVWLLLILHNFITFSVRSAYVAVIIASASTGASWPLRFEMASDLCYPVDEALSVGVLGLAINLYTSFFLAILFVPDIGTVWIDWSLVICSVLSLPFLCFVKESYKRSAMDTAGDTAQPISPD